MPVFGCFRGRAAVRAVKVQAELNDTNVDRRSALLAASAAVMASSVSLPAMAVDASKVEITSSDWELVRRIRNSAYRFTKYPAFMY